MKVHDAAATARALPWRDLLEALEQTLADQAAGRVQAPERWVLPVATATSRYRYALEKLREILGPEMP